MDFGNGLLPRQSPFEKPRSFLESHVKGPNTIEGPVQCAKRPFNAPEKGLPYTSGFSFTPDTSVPINDPLLIPVHFKRHFIDGALVQRPFFYDLLRSGP